MGQHRRRITFAASASPPESPKGMRRVSSSPGNLHRSGKRLASPADDYRKIAKGFLLNLLAVGVSLVAVTNAPALAAVLLPADTASAAAAAAAAGVTIDDQPTFAASASQEKSLGGSLLRIRNMRTHKRGARSTAGFAGATDGIDSNWSDATSGQEDDAIEWTTGTTASESDDVGVLLGALTALLVCLLGIRTSLIREQAEYDAAHAKRLPQ